MGWVGESSEGDSLGVGVGSGCGRSDRSRKVSRGGLCGGQWAAHLSIVVTEGHPVPIPLYGELHIVTSLSATVLYTWKRDCLESEKILSFGVRWAWTQSWQVIATHVHNSYAFWLLPNTLKSTKYWGQCHRTWHLSSGPNIGQSASLSPGEAGRHSPSQGAQLMPLPPCLHLHYS